MSKSIRYTIVLVISLILAIAPVRLTNSCGWFPQGECFRVALFYPDLHPGRDIGYFYYSIDFLNLDYGDENNDVITIKPEDDAYTQEWFAYCKGQISHQSIYNFLYSSEPEAFISQTKKPSSIKNEFVRYLLSQKDKEAYDYLVYAKKYEHLNLTGDPWEDYAWDTKDKDAMAVLLKEGLMHYPSLKSNFIKFRYGFQFVRAARYCQQFDQVISFYDQYIKNNPEKSVLRYRAMGHKATALYFKGRVAESDFLFSREFVDGEYILRAFQGFSGDSIEQTLKFAKSRKEIAGIYMLQAFRNPGRCLHALKRIYQLNPTSEKLEALVVREVNKLEDWILTPKYSGYESGISEYIKLNRKSDIEYAKRVLDFVRQVAEDGKIKSNAFWNLCAAHLSIMDEDYYLANLFLSKINRKSLHSPGMKFQFQVSKLLLLIHNTPSYDAEFEKQFVKNIHQIQTFEKTIKNFDRFFSNLMLAMFDHYRSKQKTAYAALFHSKVISEIRSADEYPGTYFTYLDEHATPQDMDTLTRLLNKKKTSAFEKFLIANVEQDKNRLLDLYGTLYLRQDSLEQALKIFSAVPNSFWNDADNPYVRYLNANPFYTNQAYESQHVKSPADTIRFTKPQLVSKIIDLKNKVAVSSDPAYTNYLLGNAYYNMTFYGNSWLMTAFYWSSRDVDEPIVNTQNNFYLGCNRAKYYYEKGMKTRNKPLAALNCRMASICEMNNMLYRSRKYDAKKNKYLLRLNTKYNAYYETLVTECTTSDAFLEQYAIR
jgi:hypothetical protein